VVIIQQPNSGEPGERQSRDLATGLGAMRRAMLP
jgi:hypothetical protein